MNAVTDAPRLSCPLEVPAAPLTVVDCVLDVHKRVVLAAQVSGTEDVALLVPATIADPDASAGNVTATFELRHGTMSGNITSVQRSSRPTSVIALLGLPLAVTTTSTVPTWSGSVIGSVADVSGRRRNCLGPETTLSAILL